LPDGIISTQFGYILEGLAMEDVGIFCGHLVYFKVFLLYFLPFWYVVPTRKNLAALLPTEKGGNEKV
jgi:hypothetical protein